MRLRLKVLAFLGSVLALAFGGMGIAVRILVLEHTAHLEREETLQRIQTLETILQREQKTLQQTATDWGTWDDMYAYMAMSAQSGKGFEQSNFQDIALRDNDLHLVLLLRENGDLRFSKGLDMPHGRGGALGYRVSRAWDHLSGASLGTSSGFLRLPEGVLMVATVPVTTTDGKAPPRGTLLLGRFLRASDAVYFSSAAGFDVSFWPLPSEDPDLSPVLARISRDRHPLVVSPGSHTIFGYTVIRDPLRHPVLLFRVGYPRTLLQNSLRDLGFFSWASALGGLLLLFVSLALIDRLVVRRLTIMASHIVRIEGMEHLDARIPEEGHDELTQVAGAINRMLSALETARNSDRAVTQRFLALVENIPGAVYRSLNDGSWTKVYLSERFFAITGYRPEDFLQNRLHTFSELIHPEDLPGVLDAVAQSLHRGTSYDLWYRIRTAGGALRWINDRGRTLSGIGSETSWLDGVLMDMTDQVEAMERLQASEALHRSIFENSGTALLVAEQNGHILRANEEFCRLTGYDRAEVEGHLHWERIFSPTSLQRIQAHDRLHEFGHPPHRYEAQITDRLGHTHDVVMTMDRLPDGIRRVASLLDISEMRRTQEALQESERRFREMTDSLPQTIFEADFQGRLTFVNPAGRERFHLSEDALRRGVSVLEVVAPEDRLRARENFEKLLQEIPFPPQEYVAQTSDGIRFPMVVYSRITCREGRTTGVRGIVIDISERKAMEEQLRFLSLHDPLTGLYNRAFFEEESRRMASGRFDPLGVVAADLDCLKLINDLLGHPAGDRLLQEAAHVLRHAFRASDVVARMGGDEFAALLPRCDEKFAQEALLRIHTALAHYNAQHPELPLSLSVGCVCGRGIGSGLTSLLAEADNLMYQQKHTQSPRARATLLKNLLQDFSRRTPDTAREETLMEQLMRRAQLPDNEISRGMFLARFHDLGYVGISEAILDTPGPLSEEATRDIHRHPEIGHRIALACPDIATAAELILRHHERPDGTGYPQGLRGDEIPHINRLFAVVDAFVAMTSSRPWRSPRSREEALDELDRGRNRQFDPEATALFLAMLRDEAQETPGKHSSPKT